MLSRRTTVTSGLTLASLVAVWSLAAAAPRRPAAHLQPPRQSPAPSWEKDVQPILARRCAACHGEAQRLLGFDVRTPATLLRGGASGPGFIPGAAAKSVFIQKIVDGEMPPGGATVPAAELATLRQWVDMQRPAASTTGAWWSFRPAQRPRVPKVKAASRVRNPVDAFVLAELEQRGLSLSPEADRRTLIRRITLDLIGLPPTPEEVDAFVKDGAPDAYEKLVDRLLADPRYGERWARHWLDAAGYAESEGVLAEDRVRPNAWRYRDYVIRSLNEDKPYDRFVREQIAGDELVDYRRAAAFTPEVVEPLVATGYLRTAVDATRDDFPADPFAEYQYRMLHDTQQIVFTGLLGLTLHCAKCHDHKFEPLTQQDYYQVQSLFMGAIRPKGKLLPTYRRQIVEGTEAEQQRAKEVNAAVDVAVRELNAQQAALTRNAQLQWLELKLAGVPEGERAAVKTALHAALTTAEASRTAEQKALVAKYGLALPGAPELRTAVPVYGEQFDAITAKVNAEQGKRIALREIRALYDQDANPPPTRLLIRGDWRTEGPVVQPGIPRILDDSARAFSVPAPAPGASSTGRRKAFAEWLTRPDQPLLGRVQVNRLWAHHFGTGIVATVDNFGFTGAPPTNQPLLDWLTVEFRDRGWSQKALHRLMVTSATYRQASTARADGVKRDRENRYLWRMNRRRLEAEAVRDAMLTVTGTLDPKMYGEPVPVQGKPDGQHVPVGEATGGRRSIYVQVRRSTPVDLLQSFDQPVIEINCTRRTLSTTATQALQLLNSEFVSSQGAHFARRVLKEQPPAEDADNPATIERAFRLALGRRPTEIEQAGIAGFLREQAARYAADPATKADAVLRAYGDLCQALLSGNEFIYID